MRLALTVGCLLVASWVNAAITVSNITYSSSIDAISDLLGVVYFDASVTNQPVLVYIHGYGGTVASPDTSIFTNFVGNGWFCLSLDLRGRDGTGGHQDDAGREVMDIYDGLAYVRSHCNVSQSNAVLMGVSGGGGITFGSACKLTDTFGAYVSYFGIGDYGYDPVSSWYALTTEYYRAPMRLNITGDADNGNPTNYPAWYQARDATEAIGKNLYGGWLYAYVNNGDVSVYPTNTGRLKLSMDAAGRTNYTIRFSDSLYVHGYEPAPLDSQSDWIGETNKSWTMPTSGTVRVLGWIKTKLWSIWLGGGTNQVADCVYDSSAGQYNLTPVTTGTLSAAIVQTGRTSQTVSFSSATNVTLEIPPTPALPISAMNATTANVGTMTMAQ